MTLSKMKFHPQVLLGLAFLGLTAVGSWVKATPPDTIVQFDTTLGSFQVELFDSATPVTVANFLDYVSAGRYQDSIIHRSLPGFVIQGGGYAYPGNSQQVMPIPMFPPIVNEHGLHNARGTIAMATASGSPNSATSQWFFNLADNSANLDFQNGGFTVFGQVLSPGMNIVDAIAAVPTVNAGIPFETLPVINFNGTTILKSNLVFVNDVKVVPEPPCALMCGLGTVSLGAYRTGGRFRRVGA
jgi:cyclophilin family peptidyl-prolyl cis-trans isomerase